jgi:hypothetical protein
VPALNRAQQLSWSAGTDFMRCCCCRTTKKGYEEVHVPALKPKPFEDGKGQLTAYYCAALPGG